MDDKGLFSIEESSSDPPEWLRPEIYVDLLNKYLNTDSTCILSCTGFPIDTVGFNKSILFRTSLLYETSESLLMQSYFVKIEPHHNIGFNFKQNKLFDREIFFYTEIVPMIEAIKESVVDTVVLVPKFYFSTKIPETMLFFEDVTDRTMWINRSKLMFNYTQTLHVIRKLGRLHGYTAIVHYNDPSKMEMFTEGRFIDSPEREELNKFLPALFGSIAREVQTWGVEFKEVGRKLFAFERTVFQKARQLYIDHPKSFKVLNNNDLWPDNVMINYRGDTVLDCILVDFQHAYFGSPGIDLTSLLYAATLRRVRQRKLDFMIDEYYEALMQTLERGKFEGEKPTLEYIKKEIQRKSFNAVLMALIAIPMTFREKPIDLKVYFADTDEGDALRRSLLKEKDCIQCMKDVLWEFYLLGYLN